MLIRDATVGDAPALATIHVAAWRAAYAGLMPADFLAGLDVEASRARWERGLQAETGNSVLLVESEDQVAGFCIFGPSRDSDAPPHTDEVIAINLDPTFWRKGLGRGLLQESLSRLRARGFSEATLWVLHGNDRARRFHEALGWNLDGAEKHDTTHTGVPLHEVRYRLDLSNV